MRCQRIQKIFPGSGAFSDVHHLALGESFSNPAPPKNTKRFGANESCFIHKEKSGEIN